MSNAVLERFVKPDSGIDLVARVFEMTRKRRVPYLRQRILRRKESGESVIIINGTFWCQRDNYITCAKIGILEKIDATTGVVSLPFDRDKSGSRLFANNFPDFGCQERLFCNDEPPRFVRDIQGFDEMWSTLTQERPQAPSNEADQIPGLTRLLSSLHAIDDSVLLKQWLIWVANEGITTEEGILPDNHALDIFRQLLTIDPKQAIATLGWLINAKNAPCLCNGVYQFALIGALTSFVLAHEYGDRSGWKNLIREQIEVALSSETVFLDNEDRASIAAGLTGAFLVVSENDITGASATEALVKECLSRFRTSQEKRQFLQFLADSLVPADDEEFLKRHLLKLLYISRFFSKKSVLWHTALVDFFQRLKVLANPAD